ERADQVRDEERRDDEEQEQVPPAPTAERDPVRERIAEQQREHRRDPCVLERARELRAVPADRGAVVPPRPRERVADVEVARLERLVDEKPERDREEEGEVDQPRRKQEVRRQAAVAVQESQALFRRYDVIRFCHWVMYFSLLSAFASMLSALSSICFVGKMSVFLAIAGSFFSSTCF